MSFNGGATYTVGGGVAKIHDGTWLTLKGTFVIGGDTMIDYEIALTLGVFGGISYRSYTAESWWKPTQNKLEKQRDWANAVLAGGGLTASETTKFERLRDSAVSMLGWGRYYP